MLRSILLTSLFISETLWADGLPLHNGRYTGQVLIFDLSETQKKVIDQYRTCQLKNSEMNVYTPYIFTLTPSQSEVVKAKAGFSPKRFEIYETVRGFNDAGPHWNLALRFSENQFEVPLDLLLSDKKAKRSHDEQGWKTMNPCFPKLIKN
jgi:hypothetical protein